MRKQISKEKDQFPFGQFINLIQLELKMAFEM